MRIVIDPGHGGNDPGAVGLGGLQESHVALAVALRLERRLVAAGHIVKLTRTTDLYRTLSERARTANMFDCDLFLSLHCNAAADRSVQGFEVWTSPGQTRADKIADEIFLALGRAHPGTPGRRDLSDGDNDREASFAVLRLTRCPAVLVELDFVSHPEVEEQMQDNKWLDAVAAAVAEGLHLWRLKAPEVAA